MKINKSNSLIFESDSNIAYQKSDISNNIDYMPTLDELFNLIKNDISMVFSVNTSKCLMLIMPDETEIPLCKYNIESMDMPVFLKITTNELVAKGNEIFISLTADHFITEKSIFSAPHSFNNIFQVSSKNVAIKNFNGYLNSQRLAKYNTDNTNKLSAVEHCMGLKPIYNKHEYQGYLPSIGQLNILMKYADILNYIFEYFNGNTINFKNSHWRSSTLYSGDFVWIASKNDISNISYTGYRFECSILPVFKCMTNNE